MPLLCLVAVAPGCTSSHGNTYSSGEWQEGRPLGKVMLVVSRRAPSNAAEARKDREINAAVRDALARVPGTTVIAADSVVPATGDMAAQRLLPVSEASAIAAGRAAGAHTVCLVTLGTFGGRYLLTALPPGWDARTTVQYAVRLLDVQSGHVLLESVRERTAGGYLAIKRATSPADLTADLATVLGRQSP
jgi:hypothetical protein